ncbi:MAG: NADH-quinone oxidoreductase subunit A 1 [Candidatus Woesearchaeota archaeon]|nr:MAG: NADH-quinone oxidoreductase subunit A 1 [Candidatus Woesearchaeota archaeon]GIX40450.1 MAG: NADH-quinone oxidoreductase subunit A 1 [Leptospiraceae bacterium]
MTSIDFLSILPILITLLLAMAIPAVFLTLSYYLGPKNNHPTKLSPYECGIPTKKTVGDARHRFHVKFYLVAMFFLIFDVEVLFLLPWAVWFQNDLQYGIISMFIFIGILFFGWYYLLKRGGLEWE